MHITRVYTIVNRTVQITLYTPKTINDYHNGTYLIIPTELLILSLVKNSTVIRYKRVFGPEMTENWDYKNFLLDVFFCHRRSEPKRLN